MSELKFPLYYRLGGLFFKWTAPKHYYKSTAKSISDNALTAYSFAEWVTDNPTSTRITQDEYEQHTQEVLATLQKAAS